jgi:hypothetical protein
MASNTVIDTAALREPGVSDPKHYARRVTWLAIVYPLLLLASLTGIALLVWRGELFVTLAQRSNVETLTIAFLLLFFGYFSIATAPGALGALRIAWFRLRLRTARDPKRVEERRLAALGKRGPGAAAAFDRAIELDGKPGEAWEIEVRDDVGSLGRLRFDGVSVRHVDTFRGGSNTLLGYVERKLRELTRESVSIVQWASTGGEEHLQYLAVARALEATFPKLVMNAEHRGLLEQEVGELCGALRDEAFLPDWEFGGEHKLPIIPEPLGIISLSRSEKRVDPLSSMTAALVMIVIALGVICYFLVRPPWIPGR